WEYNVQCSGMSCSPLGWAVCLMPFADLVQHVLGGAHAWSASDDLVVAEWCVAAEAQPPRVREHGPCDQERDWPPWRHLRTHGRNAPANLVLGLDEEANQVGLVLDQRGTHVLGHGALGGIDTQTLPGDGELDPPTTQLS